MEEVSNITKEEVLELVKSGFPVRPYRHRYIITVNMEEDDLMLESSGLSETQYIMSVPEHSEIVPGTKVLLDLEKMMEYVESGENSDEKVGRIKLKPIDVHGRMYAIINDNVIEAFDYR